MDYLREKPDHTGQQARVPLRSSGRMKGGVTAVEDERGPRMDTLSELD